MTSLAKGALVHFARLLDAVTYTADGAIAVRPHRALLDGEAASAAMTLAAPGADMVGKIIFVVAINVDNTVDVDFTGPGGAVTITFSNVGDTAILYAATATDWVALAAPGGTANGGSPTALTQTYSTAEATHAARAASALTDNSGGAAANGTIGAVTVKRSGHAHYTAPDAAGTTGAADQLDISAATGGETMANIVQPDYPRNVVLNFTDADTSIDAFQVDVVGFAPDGSAATEQFLFAGGLDQTGSVIFSRITSVTLTSVNGNGASDTLDLGYGVKLGVPVPAGTSDLVIEKLTVDGARENPSATDQANNSFTATTAPDASNNYDVFFSYTDPIASALRDAIKELSTAVNNVRTDQVDTAQFLNSVVDILQARNIAG